MTTCPALWVHPVKGIDPIADFGDTTQYTPALNCKDAAWVRYLVYKAVGATGTSTLTVVAADDTTGTATTAATNETAVVFKYRTCTSTDVWGSLTDATTSGFTTTAGSSQMYEIWVDTKTIANTGYGYCRLKMVEVVNSPVLGGVLSELHGNRFNPMVGTQIT